MDTSEDPDTEEALKGFDFLSSPDEMDTSPESRGNGDGTDWGKSCRLRSPQQGRRYCYIGGQFFEDTTHHSPIHRVAAMNHTVMMLCGVPVFNHSVSPTVCLHSQSVSSVSSPSCPLLSLFSTSP